MWLDRLSHAGSSLQNNGSNNSTSNNHNNNTSNSSNNNSRSGSPLPRRTSGAGGSRGPYVTSLSSLSASSSAQQRQARGSSLSLVSSDSTASLLSSSRRPNGSALRQSTTVDTSEEEGAKARDAAALALLSKVLGPQMESGTDDRPAKANKKEGTKADAVASPNGTTAADAHVASLDIPVITQEDFALGVHFGGLSLREFAWDDSAVAGTLPIRTGEELDRDRTKLEELHKSIRACDEVLNSVETNLTSFRNDLELVAADIENLQARSTALNVRLDNRKAVEKGLSAVVEDLSVSPMLVTKIVEGHIDEQWVQCLKEVDRRAASLRNGRSLAAAKPPRRGGKDGNDGNDGKSGKDRADRDAEEDTDSRDGKEGHRDQEDGDDAQRQQSKAAADLGPLLDKLILKAIERIRDFLVAQIKSLRSPHINAQIIQQQSFLKFRDLFTFLHKHHSVLADEICLAYMNTMRWYYLTQFTRYAKSLEKLRLHALDKNDVLGRRVTVAGSGGGGGGLSHYDAFSLGRRGDLLKGGGPNQLALPSYLAEEEQATVSMLGRPGGRAPLGAASSAGTAAAAAPAAPSSHYLEVPFRHFNLALVDNATAEYTFLAGFFAPALSFVTISRHFNYIFEPTFALGQSLTRSLTADSYDALGVLLCIRLNQHYAFELQRRKVPAVDGYINATNMLLWPRFQVIMDHHSESTHQLEAAGSSNDGHAGTAGPAAGSAAPHLVAQRFGQLLQGILALSTEAGDDEPVVTSLHRLRSEVEAFLTRHSQASFGRDRRKRERFLYNNYSLILTIISDVHGGKLAAEQKQHMESLKMAFQEGA